MTSMDTADSESGPVFDHDSFRTIASTTAGYAIIILVMFAILFLVPYAIFTFLG